MEKATCTGRVARRVLAVLLSVITLVLMFPTTALAWNPGAGVPCSSWYGDVITGSDGAAYYHPAPWSAMIYDHSNGTVHYNTYKGGQAYQHFTITSSDGDTRWAYCIEGGVGFETSTNAYYSDNGPSSAYFQLLPRTAQYGIMLAALYGWGPGKSLPIGGINANDYYMATQVIIWEYQQQLRSDPHSRHDNGIVSANQFYGIIAGRPAEAAYNWILGQMASHNTIPSFTASSAGGAREYELKWNTTTKVYELTLTDTNNTFADLQTLAGSGVTIARSGNKYTFTSSKMIMNAITFQFRKNIPIAEDMLVWGRPGYQTLMTGADDPVVFFMKIKTETYGWAKLIKTSEDGIVEGINFTIAGTDVLGNKVNVVVTTGPGGVVTKELLPGTYLVTEHPVDRYVTPAPQTVVIESGQTSSVSFHNILKKFRVMVTKADVENGYPQGDAKLGGAVYGIYKGEQLVDRYTTDANGQFTTKYYICGTDWTLREISPSEGYLLDPTVYPIDADPKLYTVELNTTEVHAKEQVIKGDIRLIKHTDEWDPEIPEEERDESANAGKIEKPEVGAQFQIYLKRAGSYDAANEWERDLLTTDEYGQAQSKNLPYGRYVVHQIAGEEGKNFIPDFTVYISAEGKTYQYILNNDTIMGRVKIEKHDAETGQIIPIAGVGFKVRDLSTGEFISQTVWYPTPIVIDEFYTSDEGWLMLPEELPYGQYELIEIETCYGYVLDGTPVPFAIDGSEPVITVTKHNMPQKGQIIIHKEGEIFASVVENEGTYQAVFEVAGLEGSTFDIIADEDIYTGDGTLRAAKDEVVATITTGPDGYARTESTLYLGKYRCVETKAAPGMVLNPEVFSVELAYADQLVEVTTTEIGIYNERQKVAVDLLKTLEIDALFKLGENGEHQAVRFGLFAAEDIMAADGSKIPADGLTETVSLSIDEELEKLEDALLHCFARLQSDLPFGSYYLMELATDKHFTLSDTKYPFTFEYGGQDIDVVHITVNEGAAIENKLIRGSVDGIKVGEEGEGLEGAVIGLFHPDDKVMSEETALMVTKSAKDGSFSFAGIPFGHWVIRELAPPAHYVLSEEFHHVYIGLDGQHIEIEIGNRLIRGNVQVVKTDAEFPDRKLPGAEFELYKDSNGDKKFDKGDERIGVLEQPDGGIHERRGLLAGGYFILESKAPANFKADPDPHYFEITKDGETVVVENHAGKGFVNEPMRGSLRIIKSSSDGRLQGFSFRVDGKDYSKTFTTNEKGEIYIEGLRVGRYTVSEVSNEATAGYILPDPVTVDVPADKTVEVRVHNNKVTVTVPKTGDEIALWLILALAGIGTAGLVPAVVIFFRRRRRLAAAAVLHAVPDPEPEPFDENTDDQFDDYDE